MKRKFLILVVLCIMLMSSSIVLGESNLRVYLNGNIVGFPDAVPFISNGRTLVPVRFIAESLGAKVDWSQSKQEVTIEKGKEKIVLKIGEKKATVGTKVIELDTNAVIKQSRTFVPLRFISETLDATVEWEGKTSSVIITTEGNKKVVIKPIAEVIRNKELIHSDIIKVVKFIDKDMYDFELVTFEGQLFILSDIITYEMLFIQNGKIINQVSPMPSLDKVYYPIDFALEDIELIGIYNFNTDTMEVVENPFR